MVTQKRAFLLFGLIIFVLGFVAGHFSEFENIVSAQSNQVFEMRTYTTHPGRLDALNARFRDHTTRIFEKHSIKNIGYWTTDVGESNHELTYMVAFEDANQRMEAWESFRNDPEWAKVVEDSHRDGLIVKNVRNQTLVPTPYSPMQ